MSGTVFALFRSAWRAKRAFQPQAADHVVGPGRGDERIPPLGTPPHGREFRFRLLCVDVFHPGAVGQAANNVLAFVDPYCQRCKLPHRQSAPFRTALSRFARSRFARLKSVPLRSAWVRSAPLRSAQLRSAPRRSAQLRSAPRRSAHNRLAPPRLAARRFAVRKQAPDRLASPRSNRRWLFFRRHPWMAAAPCLTICTCSELTIPLL